MAVCCALSMALVTWWCPWLRPVNGARDPVMPLAAPCRARCRTSPGSRACLGVKLAVGRCVSDAVVALYTACMVTAPDFADRVMHTLAHAFPERRVLGVWLYGSHARGQATPRSDVDLAVLADR